MLDGANHSRLMADQNEAAGARGDGEVYRPGGVFYLRIPAHDVTQSVEFFRAVFGWQLRGDPRSPSFSDGTGQVIGRWQTDLPAASEAGVLPYVYVDHLDDVLRNATDHGAEIITPPYPEGDLWVATIRDPGGNVIGSWHKGPR